MKGTRAQPSPQDYTGIDQFRSIGRQERAASPPATFLTVAVFSALVISEKWVTLAWPYPMGFFAKNMERAESTRVCKRCWQGKESSRPFERAPAAIGERRQGPTSSLALTNMRRPNLPWPK